MNAPDLNEIYRMQPNEQKILCEENGNVCKFTFVKEDHTAGNMIRVELLNDKHVIFAGYRQPHPLKYVIEMTIRTDGVITPKVALENALDRIIRKVKLAKEDFDQATENLD
ncbi:DNA-directed RNA polymerase II subunit RPB11, putative [Entamoeba invadens IP1]|uniref:DNA-directed RNA polymerase II subunit RPB11, putative n=1 Tax=Entamoeba invadens IP1 TaxID=370355 RepID=A0A0A1UEZ6_ENTIV|nr:DNA-directed RNA polymerase II subunit RPB11, putative [Entamoeba invadens IP1]ELP95160.1 DNA-directed RNA polymerase II subunit RPB11, putative [Entamoeba invadens IP1]|eukprot:XP_004261931.1 DNA-directed RNA polymerase II subunit RPB11, putative [Entamoeba invadens IP1]